MGLCTLNIEPQNPDLHDLLQLRLFFMNIHPHIIHAHVKEQNQINMYT